MSKAPITTHWNTIDIVVAKLRRRLSGKLDSKRLSENNKSADPTSGRAESQPISASQVQVSAASF
jgi:hypothetical protein